MAELGSMRSNKPRPLSPHLSIYRWEPNMVASIMHRVMGVGMATVGMFLLTMGLLALSTGAEPWSHFIGQFRAGLWLWLGRFIGIGLTYALFYHMFNGIRHLVMDIGAGYELHANKHSALVALVGAVVATALVWVIVFMRLV